MKFRRTARPAGHSIRVNGKGAAGADVPELTVVVCTYNRYDVLPDAIARSPRTQTIDAKKPGDSRRRQFRRAYESQKAYWDQHVVHANRTADRTMRYRAFPRAQTPRCAARRATFYRLYRRRCRGDAEADANAHRYVFARSRMRGAVSGSGRADLAGLEPAWLHTLHRGYFTIDWISRRRNAANC